ncbi:MAG TPA: ATP-binding protein [Nostocaceae cyanobacterium]|nr:ATP-binding protein [Nostocaceae cyanobacterium]
MLVEFSVENYRSFQEKQTFSMVASDDETMLEHNTFPMSNTNDLRLLKSAAIYGPNASGKSNLIKAMQTLRRLVTNSASRMQTGDKLPIEPFRLNSESAQKPTTFEVIFIHEGTRYEYGVSFNQERIYEEWLIAYPNEVKENWFSRQYIPNDPRFESEAGYKWSFPKLKGEKKRIQKLVRPNSLFLSHAAQNNHPQITPIFEYFFDKINIINSSQTRFGEFGFSINMCEDNIKFREQVVNLLNQADIGISDIRFESRPLTKTTRNLLKYWLSQEFEHQEIEDSIEIDEITRVSIITIHKMNDSNSAVEFDMDDESNGTSRLFSIAGYWLYVLQNGEVLIVDELESSLHPELSKALVKMFNDPEVNKNNAQLIFATHDTTLLDEEILRPDQIWLTDKDNSMTKLYSLLDFRVREDESLQKGYLSGRYGAIPYIKRLTI